MNSFLINMAAGLGCMIFTVLTLYLHNWFSFVTLPAAIACAVCWGKTITGEWDFDK